MDRNRLGDETSPYLLQHKDNPVHWQAWGEAALTAAKAEGHVPDQQTLVEVRSAFRLAIHGPLNLPAKTAQAPVF